MNAKQDQPLSSRSTGGTLTHTGPGFAPAVHVDPPATRKSWFSSYDEEWSALMAQSAIRKTLPGINNSEPEPLPRVWNSPH